MPAPPAALSHVLGYRDFRQFLGGRFAAGLVMQMQSVAIGWFLYDRTGDPLVLAYAGLAIFVPIALFTLPGGDIADRFDRRWILGAAHLIQSVCGALLVILAITASTEARLFYAVLALSGTARAFSGPAVQSFTPFLVPRPQLANAMAWGSSVNQTAMILGPAVGGALYLFGPMVVFGVCAGLSLVVATAMLTLRTRIAIVPPDASTTAFTRAVSGFRYVRRQPLVFGSILLDLFAVLLGGITALLPIYARDILAVGPNGLGLLRTSMAVGAVSTALLLANLPAERHRRTGVMMFVGVALFGVTIIVFGLSTNFVLSLAMLALMGAGDMMSVFVRNSIVQLATPDDMRGRVSAVYMLFVGASNELGDFRAGLAAAWFGTLPAVLLGGVSTLTVVALFAWLFPGLRRIDRLTDVTPRPGS